MHAKKDESVFGFVEILSGKQYLILLICPISAFFSSICCEYRKTGRGPRGGETTPAPTPYSDTPCIPVYGIAILFTGFLQIQKISIIEIKK